MSLLKKIKAALVFVALTPSITLAEDAVDVQRLVFTSPGIVGDIGPGFAHVLAQREASATGQIETGLAGVVDLTRIGSTRYSLGGAAARHFGDRDPRGRVSITIDETDFPQQDETIRAPHLDHPDGLVAALLRADSHTSARCAGPLKHLPLKHCRSFGTILARVPKMTDGAA